MSKQEEKWISEGVICSRCNYGWVATHPNCNKLECPHCHYMNNSTLQKAAIDYADNKPLVEVNWKKK